MPPPGSIVHSPLRVSSLRGLIGLSPGEFSRPSGLISQRVLRPTEPTKWHESLAATAHKSTLASMAHMAYSQAAAGNKPCIGQQVTQQWWHGDIDGKQMQLEVFLRTQVGVMTSDQVRWSVPLTFLA